MKLNQHKKLIHVMISSVMMLHSVSMAPVLAIEHVSNENITMKHNMALHTMMEEEGMIKETLLQERIEEALELTEEAPTEDTWQEEENLEEELNLEDKIEDELDLSEDVPVEESTPNALEGEDDEVLIQERSTVTVNNMSELRNALADTSISRIEISNDIQLDGTLTLPTNRMVTISSSNPENPIILTSANVRHFNVEVGRSLTLEHIILDGNGAGGGVSITGTNAIFTMNSGASIRNNTVSQGGGVDVQANGIFTMEGGSIHDNTANNGAGGVFVFNSTFTMNDGEIGENSALWSGGVHIFNSTFTMNGGVIHANTASGNGGGVHVQGNSAIFNMNGGNIYHNNANNGSGVFVQGGAFNMRNTATIHNNRGLNGTTNNGNGVHVAGGTFTMHHGVIRDHLSTSNEGGNGVRVTGGTFIMNNGSIHNNNAPVGGGVHVTGGTFNMINGEIYNNHASRGGGVLVTGDNAVFTMNGGAIDANTAASYGGGIYHAAGTVNIQNGSIRNNEASESGGGIYSYHFSALTTSNQVQFQGNSARFSTTFRGNPEDYPMIRFASTSFGHHVLNNYDINYGTETGELMFWDVPEVVSFEGVKLSDTTSIVNRANDWELIVHDGRGSGSTWRMKATLTEQFINEAGQPLRGDLMYGDQIMKENLAIPVFDYTTTTETEIPVRWSEDEGIRMRVNPSSFIGHYTGTLMWTLVDAP